LRKICWDEKAKASFAIAGVLVLMLGSVSAVYLAMINNDYRNSLMENKDIRTMNAAIDKAHIEVQTEAYYLALNAILDKTQIHPGSGSINSKFRVEFSTYIYDNFPKPVDLNELEVKNYYAKVVLRQKNTTDYVRENKIVLEMYNGKHIDELNLSQTDEYQETTRTPYYMVWGYVNYTIKERATEKQVNKNLTINRTIQCLYPYLEESLQVFAANAQEDSTDLGRMVKYILTTCAQYRVINEEDLKVDEDWESLITLKDVEQAVNIAILLEEIRRFRTVDPESYEEFNRNNIEDMIGLNIMHFIEGYVSNGIIDPAYIFALYNGFVTTPDEIDDIFVGDTKEASKVANTQFQLGSNYNQPFEFWEGDIFEPNDPKSIVYENVEIYQEPHYLHATEKSSKGEVVLNDINIGDDMLVYISDPEGIHYIKSLITSGKPYETKWELLIAGKIRLITRTDNKIFLGHGTHHYTWYNGPINIKIPITVSVFSDREIRNVNYNSPLTQEEIDFLDSIWDAAIPMVKWGIDYHHKYIENATDVGPWTKEKLQECTDIVRDALERALDPDDLGFVNTILEDSNEKEVGPFSAYGFTFLISVKNENTTITLYQVDGSFSFSLIIDSEYIELDGDMLFLDASTYIRTQDD